MAGAAADGRGGPGSPALTPPLRVIPPSPAQIAADPDTPFVTEVVDPYGVLRTLAVGTGITVWYEDDHARIVCSRSGLDLLTERAAAGGVPLARMLRRYLDPVREWRLRTRSLPLDRPLIMGILNLTTDSFSGDGVGQDVEAAVRHAATLRSSGADIIDVGAESARADRPVLDEADEARLVATVVAALVAEGHVVSSDTYKPVVARAALEAGAEIVNDISGLTVGADAAEEAARADAGYVLNYSYSPPKRRPDAPPVYGDVVAQTLDWMFERLGTLTGLGLARETVAIDPGIAFGKSHDEDLQVLRRLGELTTPGQPLLLAHSRKNYIGTVTGRGPLERDLETQVAVTLAYEQGARIFRVHDVAGARRAAEMAHAISVARAGDYAPDGESWPWGAGANVSHAADATPTAEAPPGQRW